MLTRREKVQFKLSLNKKAYDRYSEELKVFNFPGMVVEEGNRVNINYDINIDYFGNIVPRLLALAEMASDSSITKSASMEELKDGRIVIAECLRAMDLAISRCA